MTIDILPTVAGLIGAELPKHAIDGKNIAPLIKGEPGATSPQEAYALYYGDELQAVRMGKWKLHFPHRYHTLSGRQGGKGGTPVPYDLGKIELTLFDLENDIGETTNVADQHPEIVQQIEAHADRFRSDLGDSRTGDKGNGLRSHGLIPRDQ